MTVNEREIVLDILIEVSKGEYLNRLIKQVQDKYAYLPTHSRAFIKAVSEGTIERRITLDYIINQVSSVKVNKMKPLIRELMRMSVYQLKFMDQVPSSAAINEAVKLARKRHFNNLSGFVNGVLRNIDRMELPTDYPDLSTEFSCPSWLVVFFQENYGTEVTKEILQASLTVPPLIGRFAKNTSMDKIGELNISYSAHDTVPGAFVFDNVEAKDLRNALNNGLVIQDAASQLSLLVSGIKPGDIVVDLCAAPGGKSLYAADMVESDSGLVISRDISDMKVALIEENVCRLGLHNIKTEIWDATEPDEKLFDKADVVIADLPCSGLGVISRKTDLKYRVMREDLDSLALLQRQILDVAVRYVKPGGILLYSTCTMNPAENEEQVKYIIENYDFETVSIEEDLPEFYRGRTGMDGYLQLRLGIDKCDGFFISKMKRI